MSDDSETAALRAAHQNWAEGTLRQALARAPERQPDFLTASSEPVERLSTPLALPAFDYLADLGFPGEYPFTRGVHATGHRGRLWTMRMFAGFRSEERRVGKEGRS